MAQRLTGNKHKTNRITPRDGLWINYQLRLRGITHQNLADQLGIRRVTVTKTIQGVRRSARIVEALFKTLGYPSYEAMLAASRAQDNTEGQRMP